jgi:phage regulator Rha-like protein
MNELINTNLTISSREIARLTGKRHDNVMTDIKKMLTELDLHAPDFSGAYRTEQGNVYECYHLPRRELLILVSGYSITMRAKIIDRWQELETEANYRPKIASSNLNTDAYLESAKIMKATSEVLKDFINDKNQLAISSSQVGYQATGVDIVKASGLQLIASTQKQLLTPSQIGKQMQPSMSGQKVNVLLEDKGFQLKSTDDKGKCVWLITEKGEAFGIYQDTGKRRSCGAPVRQFKWYSSVIDELKALEVAL